MAGKSGPTQLQIEYVEPQTLVPDKTNPRSITEKELSKLRKSLDTFGFVEPIIARREDNLIIGGHQRVKANKEAKIPVIYVEGMSDEKARLLNIALNKIQGEFDEPKLRAVLQALHEDGADLTLSGFDEAELKPLVAVGTDLLTDPDEVPEVKDEDVYVKTGDSWNLDGSIVTCCDSTDIMINRDVLTDPPYGMKAVENSGVLKAKGYPPICGDVDNTVACKFAKQMNDLPSHKVVLWGANYYSNVLPASSCWIVWDKKNGLSDQMDCELAWTNINGVTRKFECATEKVDRKHPTQKPVALLAWVLERFDMGEDIYDPFGGAGSTLIACEQTGRKCVMMEIDPYYCQVIIERWQNATGKKAKLLQRGEDAKDSTPQR